MTFTYQEAGQGLAVTGFLSWRGEVGVATARPRLASYRHAGGEQGARPVVASRLLRVQAPVPDKLKGRLVLIPMLELGAGDRLEVLHEREPDREVIDAQASR